MANLFGEPQTALEWLEQWDSGRPVRTIEMGGIGPGYEQAIQILVAELIRDHGGQQLPDGRDEWLRWGADTIDRLGETVGGFSGAQVGAAKSLASSLIKRWPPDCFREVEAKDRDRLIQVSKAFPRAP